MIFDPAGRDDASQRYEHCEHICSHYGISLFEVASHTGFVGDMQDLLQEAKRSEKRSSYRKILLEDEVREHPQRFPSGSSLDTNAKI